MPSPITVLLLYVFNLDLLLLFTNRKINPADCVDMDCDGLKKAIIKDLDGTLMGSVGTYIAASEWQWDGDARRGLGDYRIPVVMLTDVNGDRISVSSIAPNKGKSI